MVLRRQSVIKRTDNRPFSGESLGKNAIGPVSMNLLMPNELEKRLNRKVSRGRAELKSLYVGIVLPLSSVGKNPFVANNMAREILTYENNLQFVSSDEIEIP